MSDYLDKIVTYVCQSTFDDLPKNVIIRSKEVVADSLAVIAAGAQEEEVKALTDRILESNTLRVATVIGVGLRTEPLRAGLINGTAGTFLELDEGNRFAGGHPAIHVVPAALAVAEENNISGRDLLTALVLGYEIAARVGIACKMRMSMHPHGTWGTVGAAVAVGKVMGYKEQAMKELINVSSSLTLATSRRTMLEGGTVRNVYAGVSGYMGILAHNLVQSGFTGERDGLGSVFGSVVSETFRPEEMTRDLGKRFEIARNYFKRHACCRYNHSTVDAMSSVTAKMPGGRIEPEKIAEVEVETYSLAAQLSDQNPKNTLAAKFSIPFAVATFIVHGHAGVSGFTPQAIDDPVVKSLTQRVCVSEDPELTAMLPDHRPARVRVVLTNGTVLEAEKFTNRGDPEDPYSPEELEMKYFEIAERVWNREVAGAIYADLMRLDELDNINQLTARMSPGV
ncbi:MAG: MmgE/PrpD family protein [Deltaproteobacteria bacterium]|nr:MmgE/PrpD family protein [Deltaproteobacteria bacterium]MBW2342068.1 MmgE/PrpD family protein [Deltaproteobacteria bacterium]